jgi:hypothetical protein
LARPASASPQSLRFPLSSNLVPSKILSILLDFRVSVSASQAHITASGTSHHTCLQPDHGILIAPPPFLIAMSYPRLPTIPSRLRLTNDLESMVTATSRDSLEFDTVSLETLCLLFFTFTQLEKPRPNISCLFRFLKLATNIIRSYNFTHSARQPAKYLSGSSSQIRDMPALRPLLSSVWICFVCFCTLVPSIWTLVHTALAKWLK